MNGLEIFDLYSAADQNQVDSFSNRVDSQVHVNKNENKVDVNYELLEELQFNNLNECKISDIEFLKRVGYEISFPLGYERQ